MRRLPPTVVMLLAPLLACSHGCPASDSPPATADADTASGRDASAPPEVDANAAPQKADAALEAPPAIVSEAGVDATANATEASVAEDAQPEALVSHHALAVALGDEHACVLKDDHTVSCWGHGVSAAQGSRPTRPVVSLAAGGPNACAVLDDGSVSCWAPALAATAPTATFSPELGAAHVVDLAMNAYAWSCAALDDGSARCWDHGWQNGVAPMTKTLPAVGTHHIRQLVLNFTDETMALYDDGTISGSRALTLDEGSLIDGHEAVTIANARSSWSWCATIVGGGVRCAEPNPAIGVPNTTVLTALTMGDVFTCGLRPNGTVSCWGVLNGCDDKFPAASYWCKSPANADGSHDVDLGQSAVALASGTLQANVCAVLVDGSVKCWGGAAADCTVVNHVSACQAPQQQNEVIGTSVDIVTSSAGRAYGVWHAIKLDALP